MKVRAVLRVRPYGEPYSTPAVEISLEGDVEPGACVESLAFDVEGLREGSWDRMLVFPFQLVEGPGGELFVKWQPDELGYGAPR